MYISYHNNPSCFEILPSISVQRCFDKYFWYIGWFTFSIEIGPDDEETDYNQ